MDNIAIIGRIKQLCREKGIRMSQFYAESGLSSGAMSQWATGKTSPRQTTVAMVAAYLGTTVEYLMTGEKEKTAQTDGLTMEQKEIIYLFSHLPQDKQENVPYRKQGFSFVYWGICAEYGV